MERTDDTAARSRREAAIRLHLARLPAGAMRRAVARAGDLAALAGASAGWLERAGVSARQAEHWTASGGDAIAREEAACERLGIRIVTWDDAEYPPLLREIPDPPLALWVRGAIPPPEAIPIAVVGPRRPTPYGTCLARRLARELARRGACIVSGGARGVDAAAHEAALAASGSTVAVLGCGVDVVYPPEHVGLFERIVAGGGLASELPLGTRPLRPHFPVRNRILAGWSRLVIVTEATERSGTLQTARHAVESCREVLAVPGPVTSPESAGTNELIARGARLTRTVEDVLAELPPDERAALSPGVEPTGEAPRAAPGRPPPGGLLDRLRADRVTTLEDLAVSDDRSAGVLLGELVALEARGLIRAVGPGWVRR